MKKNENIKYYIISGVNLKDNNRGTAALSYGAFAFLEKKLKLDGSTALHLTIYKKPWKFGFKKGKKEFVDIGQKKFELQHFYIWIVDYWVYKHIPFFSNWTKIKRILNRVSFVAAINGGDGFSDIYGTRTFKGRLFDTNLAMQEQIPLILLPQTVGPFKDKMNLSAAIRILKYATKVYVRDLTFESELIKLGIPYELTKDLSFYMQPEKVDINILPHAVGLNVSGLCYSNQFRDLSGYFSHYPQLIERIIKHFQDKNVPLYLVAHSYNYKNPEYANDDMEASKEVYAKLKDKTKVYLIDRDLTSPQTKYVISQFEFFIGTRMHANFAAIFTDTTVFGLAYSLKYEGAFDGMGLKENYASILNIEKRDIEQIVMMIDKKYQERFANKRQRFGGPDECRS